MLSRPGHQARRVRLPIVLLAAWSPLAWPSFAAASRLATSTAASAVPPLAAATLYFGGSILTMAGPTPAYAEALVERGGRIVYVGPLAGAIRAAGGGAKRVNLAGRTLLPGFIDAHGHLPDYVATWGRPDLSPPPVGSTRRIADIQATVTSSGTPPAASPMGCWRKRPACPSWP